MSTGVVVHWDDVPPHDLRFYHPDDIRTSDTVGPHTPTLEGRRWNLVGDGMDDWTAVVTAGVVTECGEAEWIGRPWKEYRDNLKARGCSGTPAP